MRKNTICLWYDHDAEEAARFYAATFPDSRVGAVHRAPSDYPGGKAGDPLVVEFVVAGVACIGLNGGPTFRPTATGTRSSATAARRASAAGARTSGASAGRSRRAC